MQVDNVNTLDFPLLCELICPCFLIWISETFVVYQQIISFEVSISAEAPNNDLQFGNARNNNFEFGVTNVLK